MPRKRAMSSEKATGVKLGGHKNERDFACLIGGSLNVDSLVDKTDVIDSQDGRHSVKAGTWWQIFLYGRDRLITNTDFQQMGRVADIMVACIDAFPDSYEEYKADKNTAKTRLQPEMRKLLAELQDAHIFRSFLEKALFNGDNAVYLSMFLGDAMIGKEHKHFHIFHKDDVVAQIQADVRLRNSKARRQKEMDDQKVTFLSNYHGRNIGEIETRHDSKVHYRQMKFRLNAQDVFDILDNGIRESRQISPQITTHGRAVQIFRLPSN